MQIPLNVIHNYIGFPVLIVLGCDALRRYRKTQNITSLYLALACLFSSVALFSFGVPALFTRSTMAISIGSLIGDYFFSFGMLWLWFIATRSFLANLPAVRKVVNSVAVGVTALLCINSVFVNLTPPYGAHLIANPNGGVALAYRTSQIYNILMAYHSISLLIIAIFFWREGAAIPNIGHRIRVQGFAVSFLIVASAFFFNAILATELQATVTVTLWSVALIYLAIMNVVGSVLSKRQKSLAK